MEAQMLACLVKCTEFESTREFVFVDTLIVFNYNIISEEKSVCIIVIHGCELFEWKKSQKVNFRLQKQMGQCTMAIL